MCAEEVARAVADLASPGDTNESGEHAGAECSADAAQQLQHWLGLPWRSADLRTQLVGVTEVDILHTTHLFFMACSVIQKVWSINYQDQTKMLHSTVFVNCHWVVINFGFGFKEPVRLPTCLHGVFGRRHFMATLDPNPKTLLCRDGIASYT